MNAQPLLRWMTERHAIYERRSRGVPRPWTTDPILDRYRFTNVFRELDRVTMWMREHVTRPIENRIITDEQAAELLLLNCVYFRWFGRPEPFDHGYLPKILTRWPDARVASGVNIALSHDCPTYTSAYTIHGDTGAPRLSFILKVLDAVWNDRASIVATRDLFSLEATFNALRPLPGFGGNGFMAYEIVTDLRHTTFFGTTPRDILIWTNTGPGSMRGLNRLCGYELRHRWKREAFCTMAQELLCVIAPRFEEAFPNTSLELRDIEHSLCEFDKYERIREGGKGKPYRAQR